MNFQEERGRGRRDAVDVAGAATEMGLRDRPGAPPTLTGRRVSSQSPPDANDARLTPPRAVDFVREAHMRRSVGLGLFFVAVATASVAAPACKSNDISETNSTTNAGTAIGAAGGILKGPDGTQLRVPAGALNKDVTFSIAVAAPGEYPPLPGTFTVPGTVYAFLPHGTEFLSPVVISLPNEGGGGDVTGIRAEKAGSWAALGSSQISGANVEMSTSTLSFYAVASAAEAPDGGGPTCSGRGPDNSAPTGKLTAMSGTYPASGPHDAVDLGTLVDGYAENSHGDIFYITLTPYAKACGAFINGVNRIGQTTFSLFLNEHEPTTGTYGAGAFSATTGGFPAGTPEDACASGVPSGVSAVAGDSLQLVAIDADHVTGSFTFKAPGGATLSGSFDVPRCSPAANLDPPGCCVK